MFKRPLASLAAVAALSLLAACSGGDDTASDDGPSSPAASAGERPGTGVECEYPAGGGGEAAKEVEAPPTDANVSGQVSLTLTTSIGELNATLDADKTPCTVNSFVSLSEKGYFDATTCHRMTTEGIFVLQCGDPSASGMGGPGYAFGDELSGDETYPAGTLAMANSGPDTNGSQFFIVYDDTTLPPAYTVFGTVDDAAVELVAGIAAEGTADGGPDGEPKTPVEIESVTLG